ncbi:MAG: SCO family protein [Bacteroidota bacterium]|nr:SCO family protein [Bacteroidota bacterium]
MKAATLSAVLIFFLAASVSAQTDEEKKFLYREVPDVSIQLLNRRASLLAFCKEEPTIISLAYSRCAGICYPFLLTLRDNLAEAEKEEKKFRVLIISFDEKDTQENMQTMAGAIHPQNTSRWFFGTIERSQIKTFTQAVGFTFTLDSLSGQLNHPPIVIGVNGDGTIVRIVKKFDISNNELWQVYHEIEDEFVPFYKENIATSISCFTYDSRKGKFIVSWGMLLLYTPAILVAILVWRIFSIKKIAGVQK